MLQAQNTTLPVGVIPGAIDISPMGAATYTIPIEVVPGTQGMQPNLSIVFNSFSGMGLLGMKWNLAGLSAITRCGQVPYYDGDMTAIQFNANDRFALDGNRLLMQSNGDYGTLEVPYATEIENFIRVVPYNGSVGSPTCFKAYTDDGTIIEYGNTSDSRQKMTDQSKILSWMINNITDANGNFMTFYYGQTNGEIWIDSIKYTGNTAAGLQAYAKVEFTYIPLPADKGKSMSFIGGYSVPQTKLLKTIATKYNNATVRKYEFNYNTSISTERTAHLGEVVLYGEDGVTKINPTTIQWGEQNTTIDGTQVVSGLPQGYIITGDFDGDGYTDIVVYAMGSSQNNWRLYLNNKNGGFTPSVNGTHYPTCCFYVYDLDMDGKDELIIGSKHNPNSNTWSFRSLRLFPSYTECIIGDFEDFSEAHFGKFYSNGMADMLILCKKKDNNTSPSTMKYDLINRSGSTLFSYNTPLNSYFNIDVADINGNGKDNVILVKEEMAYTFEFNSYGALNLIRSTNFPTKWHKVVHYGDFNGEGIKDALVYVNDGNSYVWLLHMGKGDYTFTHPGQILSQLNNLPNIYNEPENIVIIVDVNGDGKDEIIQTFALDNCQRRLDFYSLYNFSNNGICDVIKFNHIILDNECMNYKGYYKFGDFNGDGKVDVLINSYVGQPPKIVYANKNEQYELPQQITDGMGKEIIATYKPEYRVAENFVYNSSLDYYYTYQKYFLPLVQYIQISNGIEENLNKLEFFYENPTYSLSKRTFLGFTKFTSLNIKEQIWYYETQSFSFLEWNSRQILVPTGHTTHIGGTDTYKKIYSPAVVTLPNNRFILNSSPSMENILSDTKTITKNELNNEGRLIKSFTTTYNQQEPLSNNAWLHTDTTVYYYKGITLSAPWQKKTVAEKIITKQQYKNSKPPLTDTLTFCYTAQGHLNWERKGNIDGSITTTYENYLPTGVYGAKTVSEEGGSIPRTETYIYDAKYRFVTKITNSLAHEATFNYNEKTLNKIWEKDPNELTTNYTYDTLGNLTKITYPDGTQTKDTIYWFTGGNNPPNARYCTKTVSSGKKDITVYYDLLGREVCRNEDGYYYDTRYNEKGQIVQASYPYNNLKIQDNKKIWKKFTYDKHGRILTEKAPYTDLEYIYPFSGREVTVKDKMRNNITSSKDYDALGRITQAEDVGGTITYTYSVTNDKRYKTTILTDGLTTTILTDLQGNRLSIAEPSAGTITSVYNGFNELKKQIDARGDTTSYKYDNLGRVTQKRFADTNQNIQVVDYYYDTSNKGKGKLAQIKIDNQIVETFNYDALSRLSNHTKFIEGTSFAHNYTYNSNGQLQTLTYPDGFSVSYDYSLANGKLNTIRRSDDNSNSLIYETHTRNEFGTTTLCSFGNELATEYTFNPYGLVTRIHTGNKLLCTSGNDLIKGGVAYFCAADSAILNYRYACNSNTGLMGSRSERIVNRQENLHLR